MIEGPVTNLTKFGAFVQLAEGVEGMIHVSEISAEKRINHPQEVLRAGQVVKAQVLAIDPEKRLIRLSMKQLVPTGLDEYLAEHKEGDIVTGRMIEVSEGRARVELGEGVHAQRAGCREQFSEAGEKTSALNRIRPHRHLRIRASPICRRSVPCCKRDGRAALPPMRRSRKVVRAGQIRKFRIAKLDPATKKIELGLA